MTLYRILVVDDEEMIRKLIRKYAEFDGHTIDEAVDGMDAIAKFKDGSYDIIIMDIMMPELDGFSACREIRKLSDIPIIMLSARGEEYDKINGFEIGIDDYVVKPFSPKELMLRIDAIMKRAKGNSALKDENKNDVVSVANGGIVVDFTARIVYRDGERIEMSPKEYDLFFYMIKNKNIALTRDKLLSDVWGYDFFGDDRTLDTHIKILRKSLGKYSDLIVTIRGVGYRFEDKYE
jgi:DNA-binding response OmpR family regulator